MATTDVMAPSGSNDDSDDPIDRIAKVKSKFCANSRFVIAWHKKCIEEESTLVALQQLLNEALYKLAEYKCLIYSRKLKYDELVLEEEEDVRRWSIISWAMKHLEQSVTPSSMMGLRNFVHISIKFGRDMIRTAFCPRTWKIVKDGHDYEGHEYIKTAHKNLKIFRLTSAFLYIYFSLFCTFCALLELYHNFKFQ
ncbi:hypothetical protein D8674_038187 [Pyrus ussuriensis x Pyrus communis]|uniref:Uncharacterized protein n=1 Tax=Pyrus ussuriensis x Pyrus communis TaxID=2448454 RepID=A0A5N5I6E0_9ROSA|nr:hypothetical protein D8674_038187 [Pyrus ussuriensis x Pyrus communis]